jgi:hypothetical protein
MSTAATMAPGRQRRAENNGTDNNGAVRIASLWRSSLAAGGCPL